MKSFSRWRVSGGAAALVVASLAAGAATAATTGASFAVTETVLSKCLATASAVAFPNYTPGAGTVTANGAITVRCTKNTGFTVALNVGTTTGGTYAQRLMAAGANTLQYNLYTSTGLAIVFGDGSGSTATIAGAGGGVAVASAVTVPVYGQLLDSAANQGAVPGNYTDTITVTVTY